VRVILFGATGMIGQGVLRECLLDPRVARVLVIGRASCGKKHGKLEEAVVADLFDLSAVAERLVGFDACFYCLGVSSGGMSEAAYTRITLDLTLAVAAALLRANPRMRVCFISGAGADGSEKSRTMWARVKGRAENALLAMPFGEVTVFRPGVIQPLHGITSRTLSYRVLYAVLGPLMPVLRTAAPRLVTTTEQIGRAMLRVALAGSAKRVLESADINSAAAALAPPSDA
jgi:uncharacterized protein YbjT (DUF2867 family)